MFKMRLFLTVAAVFFAAPIVVAGRISSQTCESYTLKCSTSKTAWAGKTTEVKAALYNKAKGTTEDVDIGLYWNTNDFSYGKSKFTLKGYTPQTRAGKLSYEGVTMKESAKIQAVLHIDKCAATTATVAAWAVIGDCSFEVDCRVIDVKYKKHHTCNPTSAPTPSPTPNATAPSPSRGTFSTCPSFPLKGTGCYLQAPGYTVSRVWDRGEG